MQDQDNPTQHPRDTGDETTAETTDEAAGGTDAPPFYDDPVDGAARAPSSAALEVADGRARIVLVGEIDVDLQSELHDTIARAEATKLPIDVDAHQVTFIDSSGMSFLADIASRHTPPVRVLRAPPSVQFLLTVTRLDELVEVVDG